MNDRARTSGLSATFARNDPPMVSDIFSYPPETRAQRRGRRLLGCVIVALIVVPWIVGVVRIALWIILP